MTHFSISDIHKVLPSNKATAMTKFIRGRMVPTDQKQGRDSLFQFSTLEAYQLCRELMVDDSITDKQFDAYERYMAVLKGWL